MNWYCSVHTSGLVRNQNSQEIRISLQFGSRNRTLIQRFLVEEGELEEGLRDEFADDTETKRVGTTFLIGFATFLMNRLLCFVLIIFVMPSILILEFAEIAVILPFRKLTVEVLDPWGISIPSVLDSGVILIPDNLRAMPTVRRGPSGGLIAEMRSFRANGDN